MNLKVFVFAVIIAFGFLGCQDSGHQKEGQSELIIEKQKSNERLEGDARKLEALKMSRAMDNLMDKMKERARAEVGGDIKYVEIESQKTTYNSETRKSIVVQFKIYYTTPNPNAVWVLEYEEGIKVSGKLEIDEDGNANSEVTGAMRVYIRKVGG
jgi:hypothetical protein